MHLKLDKTLDKAQKHRTDLHLQRCKLSVMKDLIQKFQKPETIAPDIKDAALCFDALSKDKTTVRYALPVSQNGLVKN